MACTIAGPASAQSFCDARPIGHFGGQTHAAELVGDLLAVTTDAGLTLYDRTTPQLERVGSILFDETVFRMFADGDLVYLCAFQDGLRIVDTANPAQPTLIGTASVHHNAIDVVVVDDRAYVADQYAGLTVFDVHDPTNPQELGLVELDASADYLRLHGSTLFVTGEFGIAILDMTTTPLPSVVWQGMHDERYFGRPAVRDHYLLAPSHDAIDVFDITNPTFPQLVTTWTNDFGDVKNVELHGDNVLLACEDVGVAVLDAADLLSPQVTDTYGPNTPVRPHSRYFGIAVSGPELYAAGNEDGLLHLELSPSGQLTAIERLLNVGGMGPMDVVGDLIAWNAKYSGVRMIDVSDPAHPVTLSETIMPFVNGRVETIAFDGRYVFAAVEPVHQLVVLDAIDPSAPQLYTPLELPGQIDEFLLYDHLLLAHSFHSRTWIYDVSNPTTPVLLGPLPGSSYDLKLAIRGNLLVTIESTRLTLWDFTDPANATFISNLDGALDQALAIALRGNYCYVLDRDPGGFPSAPWTARLEVFDLTDPTEPVPLGGVPLPERVSGGALVIAGRFAHIVGSDHFMTLDLKFPFLPILMQTVELPGRDTSARYGLHIQHNTAFTTGFELGLQMIDLAACASCPADLNADDALNLDDIAAFADAFLAGDLLADLDTNRVLNLDDIAAFAVAFLAGCP